jgi:hypothetical protein
MKISMKEVKEKGNGKERKKLENEKGRQRKKESKLVKPPKYNRSVFFDANVAN